MKKYLIVVDVQNDFCPGGALAVDDGDKIIPNINKLMASNMFDRIIATQDWHPANHISFASVWKNKAPFSTVKVDYGKQMLWPDHCVMGTPGAEFRPSLEHDRFQFIVRKGYRENVDSYSGFLENDKETETGLAGLFERSNEIYICGIATDVCVLNTAMDALDYGLIKLVEDACAGVDEKNTVRAIAQMKRFNIKTTTTEEFLSSR
jgi:nicotinamidase/pyrazinamidase